MSRSELEQLVSDAMEETLAAPEGSFGSAASKSDPECYVQWIKTENGLHVEAADTGANAGIPMSPAQITAITDLGFSRDEPNFSSEFASAAEAAPPAVKALVEVFGVSDPAALEVTGHTEGLRTPVQRADWPANEAFEPEYVDDVNISWFPNLASVPGVEWKPPVPVAVEPPLSTARPAVVRYGGDPPLTLIEWLDENGDRLPNDTGIGSPADRMGRGLYDSRGTHQVVRRLSMALSLPGTKDDYFRVVEQGISALWQQDDEDPNRVRMQEHLALLGIALIETGLEEAVVPPFAPDEQGRYFGSAASPYRTLIRLYQGEGFLREAAAVFAALQQLPEAARERAYIESDPGEVLTALEELAGLEGGPN